MQSVTKKVVLHSDEEVCKLNIVQKFSPAVNITWVGCGLFITVLHITQQRRCSALAVHLPMINNSSYYQLSAFTTIMFRRKKFHLQEGGSFVE